jgi:hypothetical protein
MNPNRSPPPGNPFPSLTEYGANPIAVTSERPNFTENFPGG